MKTEIITLCAVCYRQFRDNSTRRVTRTNKKNRDTCTYCNSRMGFDYALKNIKRKGKG